MKKNLKKINQFLPVYTTETPLKREEHTEPKAKPKKFQTDHFDFIKLIQKWPEIIGEKFSKHSIPLKNQNKTLVILSNHSAFASEMKFLEQILKKKIFQVFPSLEKEIEKIQFVVDSTYFDEKIVLIKNNNEVKAPTLHQFSPEYKKKVQSANEMFNDVTDEEMRELLKSIFLQTN